MDDSETFAFITFVRVLHPDVMSSLIWIVTVITELARVVAFAFVLPNTQICYTMKEAIQIDETWQNSRTHYNALMICLVFVYGDNKEMFMISQYGR